MIPWFEPPVLEIPLPNGAVLPLHGFGLLVAIGFLVGGKVAMDRASRMGKDPEVINRLIGWLVVGTFVGGHVGYGLMYHPDEYLANPVEFLKVWQGLSSFGGFLVCVPLSIWFFWKEKVDVWRYLDCLAFGMAVGWFFGRMGCFVAHDHPGTPTDFVLGVYGICPGMGKTVACHDMGLYEALWSIGMYGLFVLLDRKPRLPGFYVLALGLSYAPVRFYMDYLRPVSTDARYFNLTPGQWGSILLGVVVLGFMFERTRNGRIEETTPPDEDAPTES